MSEVEVPNEEIEASKGLIGYFVNAPVEAYNLLTKVSNDLKTIIENTDEYTEYEKRQIMYSIGKLFQIVDIITDLRFFDLYNKYLSEPQIVRDLLLKISLLAHIYIKVLDRAYDDHQQLAKDIDVIAASLYLVLRDALEFAASEVNKSS
ncbi:MAG: hypothetical protein RXO36_08315 [Candidatus Nanopusillus acidilobi]